MRAPRQARSVFAHIRAPTRDGTRWRLGAHHVLALVAYVARTWGPVDYFSFAREPGQQRLLGYGSIVFRDPASVARMLNSVRATQGVLRVPYAARAADPAAIARTGWADVQHATETQASVRDRVAEHAPLARRGVPPGTPDHFFAKVERRERGRAGDDGRAPPGPLRRPPTANYAAEFARWGGFASEAETGAVADAHGAADEPPSNK